MGQMEYRSQGWLVGQRDFITYPIRTSDEDRTTMPLPGFVAVIKNYSANRITTRSKRNCECITFLWK